MTYVCIHLPIEFLSVDMSPVKFSIFKMGLIILIKLVFSPHHHLVSLYPTFPYSVMLLIDFTFLILLKYSSLHSLQPYSSLHQFLPRLLQKHRNSSVSILLSSGPFSILLSERLFYFLNQSLRYNLHIITYSF